MIFSFFFFSSRRRHTRYWRDWSSDVCSSDLVDVHDDTTLDFDDLERQLSERTRVVAFPLASNAVGTLADARRVAELAHSVGALAWADAVHYAPHAPIDRKSVV